MCAGRFGDSAVMFIENMIADMKEQIQYPMEDFCFQINAGAPASEAT